MIQMQSTKDNITVAKALLVVAQSIAEASSSPQKRKVAFRYIQKLERDIENAQAYEKRQAITILPFSK